MVRRFFIQTLGVLTVCLQVCAADEKPDTDDFAATVAPFLKQHCVRCHGARKQEARLMLQRMTGVMAPADVRVWESVLAQLEAGDMPPKREPRPDPQQLAGVTQWIRSALNESSSLPPSHEMVYPENGNHVPHHLLFSPPNNLVKAAPATPARIWRVRPSIYESFVEHASREPFHHPYRRESLFSTPWGLEGEGIRDYSALYWIGEAETELLMSNAMRVADIMSRKRSRFSDESNVFRSFLRSKQDSDESQKVISAAFLQILQRKPTDSESARYGTFLNKNTRQLGLEKGLQTTLAALLLHPKAVFRFELGRGDSDKQGRVRLAPAELAYAIAFALTDRAPDEELLSAAQDGSLSNARGVRAQAMRLMNDKEIQTPRLLHFFQEFFGYTKAPQERHCWFREIDCS